MAPELSYWNVPAPQVEGPADAGTAWMTANANARARAILVNMVILLVLKPEAASADLIRERRVYFRARISKRVRSVHVFVCSLRCAVHISVSSVSGLIICRMIEGTTRKETWE